MATSLAVRGRIDNAILTGGHKVHPDDVERALAALGGVDEAVVVGVPDHEWGERIVALVVPRDGLTSTSRSNRCARTSGAPFPATPSPAKF